MSFTSIILRVALIGFIIISLCGCYGPSQMRGSWEYHDCRSRIEP